MLACLTVDARYWFPRKLLPDADHASVRKSRRRSNCAPEVNSCKQAKKAISFWDDPVHKLRVVGEPDAVISFCHLNTSPTGYTATARVARSLQESSIAELLLGA